MTAIRPPFPPPATAAPQGVQGQARSAAQKAFFEAALGRAAPAQAPVQPTRTTQTAEVQVRATLVREIPQPVRTAPDEAPQKILRPGSLLDIRV